MSACTPQAAPPVTTAIVTRSPIVRVVRIMFAPRVRTRPGHIGPRFSFGFPLTGDFRTHHYLNGKAESGRHGGPRDRRALPERREPPVLDGRADHRRARPGPRDPDGLSAVRRGEEAGPAPVRLLRAHGHRGERLPPRAGPRAVPPRHVPRMQAGLPPRLRSMQEPAVRRISGARTPRVESLAGNWLRQDYEAHRHSAAEPVVLAHAKATVGAIPAQVFEALTDAAQLGSWWAEDVRVDAQMSGVYEGTLPSGRVEGTITWIEGPRKFSFEWPIVVEGASVVTSVVYELSPKGPQTVVHVSHRSPKPVPGDWNAVWSTAIESLKAYLEAARTDSTTMDSP